MKKLLFLLSILFLLVSCWTQEETSNIQETTTQENIELTQEEITEQIVNLQPEYKADLYWKIKSNEWNVYTISEIDTTKDPTIEMEQAEKQAYMQSLSEADRQALKDQINSAILWDVKVMIPVWIPMIKKELSWEDKIETEATLEDLAIWDIISIWYNTDILDRKVASYVKRSIRK